MALLTMTSRTATRGGATRMPANTERAAKGSRPNGRRRVARMIQFPGHTTPSSLLILGLAATLTGVGLVMVLSASASRGLKVENSALYFFNRQAVAAVIAVIACAVGVVVPYRRWAQYSSALVGATFGLLALILIPGFPLRISANGAVRWIDLGVTQFQPSELAKIALVIYVAKYLSDSANLAPGPVDIRPVFIIFGALAVPVLLEPDLGTTVLLFLVVVVMCLLGPADRRTLGGASAIAVAGGLAMSFGTEFRRQRMLAFLDPWAQAQTAGYQTLQAQVGFASGGLWGSGIGSAKAKYGYLPDAHTDFIFAIFGEEFGLIGSLILVSLYALLTVTGFRVAMNCHDLYGRLLAVGISTWIGAQSLINLGVATGALPNKGITLPFMSYGGTSLIMTLFAVGVLVNIARSNG
jgi:cell division protein FtsW